MKSVKSTLPTAVLVGRANVGKSTLFNRLSETHKAMISETSGTTRDRKDSEVLWRGRIFRLIDTGGLEFDDAQEFNQEIKRQTEIAIEEADIVLFVVDLRDGLLEQDRKVAKLLTGLDKPVFTVGNKAEKVQTKESIYQKEWYGTGLDLPRPVSAIKGAGLGDLLDEIYDKFAELKLDLPLYEERPLPRIAIIGEPNVGKSSIVNAIIGEDRFITSPIAHTTREPNDTLVEFDNSHYVIVDTAGIRRKAKVVPGMEKAGVRRTLDMLKEVDIAVLVLDATKPIDHQEKRLAGLIDEAGVGCIIVANKWDLVKGKLTNTVAEYEQYIKAHLPFIPYAPLLTVSALDRQRIHKLFPLFDTIIKERERRIDDNALDKFLKITIVRHKPARGKGVSHPTIYRLKQVGIKPPRFELIIKGIRTDVLHTSYLRFLENRLRERFGFIGTPIHFYAMPSKKAK